jgi:hypothetical protein
MSIYNAGIQVKVGEKREGKSLSLPSICIRAKAHRWEPK